MKLIKKIKRIMSDHPRASVFILLLALIFVIFIIYRIADKYMNTNHTETEELYTYVGDAKYEFNADITINKKKVISKIDPEININWSSTPVFTSNKIIFPSEMIVILPEDNYLEYRLMAFTYIDTEEDKFITKDYGDKINHYIIYDGEDTYVFGDAGTLKIGAKEIKLSSKSYVICSSKSITYYDYTSKMITTEELNDPVTFESDYYTVNLTNDTVGREENLLPKSGKYIDFISSYESV